MRTATALLLALVTGLLLGQGPATAQQRQRMTLPSNETLAFTDTAPTPGQPLQLPFELVNNHFVLEVRVRDGEPLRVVLDTGMPTTGLLLYESEAIDALELGYNPAFNAQVGGAGGGGRRISAKIADRETLDFGPVRFEQSRVLVIPPPERFPRYHDGIVGYSFFGNFVVRLDVGRQIMELHDSTSFQPPGDATSLPITLRGNLPYVDVDVAVSSETTRTSVVVDLGASHAISLNDQDPGIQLPEVSRETILGRGLSGVLTGKIGRVRSLSLGGLELRRVIASFPIAEHQNPRGIDSLGGNLGTDVLRRFDVTFDYAAQRMVLEPNDSFDEPFVWDHAGLRLEYGDEVSVEHVLPDSPAQAAGIEVGDVLEALGELAVSELSVDEIRARLRQPGRLEVRLRRSDAQRTVVLALRELL